MIDTVQEPRCYCCHAPAENGSKACTVCLGDRISSVLPVAATP